MNHANIKKSLEELEGEVWPYNDFGSHVVQESQRLRKVPLEALGVEDLRLLIGQKIGLIYLVPLALERLAIAPLVAGAYYRGDLLQAVLDVPAEFWEAHPALNNVLVEIGGEVSNIHNTIMEELLPRINRLGFRNE